MKNNLIDSAKEVEQAHTKVTNSRKDLKRKRTLFLEAQVKNQEAEREFTEAKQIHEQRSIEKV